MACPVCSRVRSGLFLLAVIGLGVAACFSPLPLRAVDLNVPQIQAQAERGSIDQQIKLGAAYFSGQGVEQDSKLAAYWYEKAANAGDPRAQKQIGYFYQAGIGVPRNLERAVKWYERAAAGGLISAKINLGVVYLYGLGVPKDPAMGAEFFRQALADGDGAGAFSLGEMYAFGVGVNKDPAAARHWYELGAKLENPLAEFRLADMIVQSRPSSDELNHAVKLLRRSVTAGYIPAEHLLALLMINHPELVESPAAAVPLLEQAASAGLWQSSMLLGILARDGKVMPADAAAAYYDFRVAALEGGEQAARMLANDLRVLAARLGWEQTQAKDAQARAWVQKHQVTIEFVYRKQDQLQGFPAYGITMPGDTHVGTLLTVPPS
jgi:uncharacterized protein